MPDPTRTQRLGAYAVVVHDGSILLTRISAVGYPAGHWTLPGGGVDHGESPHRALRRELLEEAGLVALSAQLVDVHDVHAVDQGRGDAYEDYHGVHLLYAVEVDPSIEPHVVDVGGTTDLARWVPLSEVGTTVGPVMPMVSHAIDHLDQFTGGV